MLSEIVSLTQQEVWKGIMSQTIAEGAVLGDIQLVKKIAAGGMAEVWEAKKTGVEGFERRVAVKVVLSHLSDNEEFIKMFFDEGRLSAMLNHPNICQIVDLNQHNGTYFMAMEFIDGFVLSSIMKKAAKRGVHIPFEHCCQIMIDSCAGLDYAHSCMDPNGDPLNLVHRDISPQNIMLTKNGAAKVVDFGIAKAANQANQTRAGVLKGKYAYMSPEQATGKPLDLRSDVFALGVVLWELSTGHRLFRAENEIATLHKIIGGDYDPPSALRENYPPGLETIVMKALAPDVDDRFQNCGEMQLALEEFLLRHGLAAGNKRLSVYLKWLMSDADGDMPDSLRQTSSVISQAFDDSQSNSGVFTPTNTRQKMALGGVSSKGTSTGIKPAPDLGAGGDATVMFEPGAQKSKAPMIIVLLLLLVGLGGGGYYIMTKDKKGDDPSGKNNGVIGATVHKTQVEWLIRSEPAGATLFVGSKEVGKTPIPVKLSTKRSYLLLLKKDGYKSSIKQFSKITHAMAKQPLLVSLKKAGQGGFGSFQLKVVPTTAKVNMDGKQLKAMVPGFYFLPKVSAGPHMLVIQARGYKQEIKPFQINANAQTKLKIPLTKAGRRRGPNRNRPRPRNRNIIKRPANSPTLLSLFSSPSGASVSINGKDVGTTPIKSRKVSPGSLKVVFSKQGYVSATRSVSISKGDSELVTVHMKKKTVPKVYTVAAFGSNVKSKVYINKKYVCKTPTFKAKVLVGKTVVTFKSIQYGTVAKRTVTFAKGKRARVVHKWKKGTLQILSRPMGGLAYINGIKLGSANKVYSGVPFGSYNIKVHFKNGKKKSKQVTISSSRKKRVKIFGR